jgi:hypothetical protein
VSDVDLVAYTEAVAAEIDRAFRQAMAVAGRRGGHGLRDRHPTGFAPELVEFRTSLGWPDGQVSAEDFAEVVRYDDRARRDQSVVASVERGALARDDDGTIRATTAGRAFVDDLYRTQTGILAQAWAGHDQRLRRLAPVLGDLVRVAASSAEIPGTFRAMEPAYEPDGVGTPVLVLNRLSALRYMRSDKHAKAWRETGLTAVEMVQLQATDDSRKHQIERRTNELSAPVFAGLTDGERSQLLDDLRALTISE